MHGSIPHLFFNMFALWMFGKTLENIWGPKRFLINVLSLTGSHAQKTFVRLVNVNSQNGIEEVKNFFKIMEDFVEENYQRLKKISN